MSQTKSLVNAFRAKALERGKGRLSIDTTTGGIHVAGDGGPSIPPARGKKRQRDGGQHCDHLLVSGVPTDTSSSASLSYPGGLAAK